MLPSFSCSTLFLVIMKVDSGMSHELAKILAIAEYGKKQMLL